MGNGLVYFVTYDNDKWRAALPVIKIGATTDLKRRLSDLSISSPIKLLVVGAISSKNPYQLENSLHRSFTRERLNGEWFKLTTGMISIIRTYKVIDDRFDELFDLNANAPDAKDLIITELKAELKNALGKIESCENTIYQLKQEFNGAPKVKEVRPSNYIDRRFLKACKNGCK